MSGISTHILDVSRGVAAAGVAVRLHRLDGAKWAAVGSSRTDADGRVKNLLATGSMLGAGTYRLTFDTGTYWESLGVAAFHPLVEVTFVVEDAARHHHVPLLLSPFGYTTYRGT